MKKLILLLISLSLLVFAFVACQETEPYITNRVTQRNTSETYSDSEPNNDNNNDQVAPSRGQWDSRIYTSDFFGFRISLPGTWEAMSDEAIAAIMGIAPDIIGDQIYIPEDMESFMYMMVINPLTGSNISVSIVNDDENYTAHQIRAIMAMEIVAMGGRIISQSTTPVALGEFYWYYQDNALPINNADILSRHFFNIRDGYIRIIAMTLSVVSPSGGFEEMQSFFFGMNEIIPATPEPEPPRFAEELIGIWSHNMYESFVYIFSPDGTGVRGFPGSLIEFTWEVHGENILVIRIASFTESWSFVIEDNNITFTSNQMPNVIYIFTAS